MIVRKFYNFTLLLSDNPCEIFDYYKIDKMHGLSLKECELYNNTKYDAYIAGWCNLVPPKFKDYFVFINLSRCTDDIRTTGLVMHELMHMTNVKFKSDWENKGEEMIGWAENTAYKIVDIIKEIKEKNITKI